MPAPCSSAPSRADSSQSGGWNRQWTAQKSCGPRRKKIPAAIFTAKINFIPNCTACCLSELYGQLTDCLASWTLGPSGTYTSTITWVLSLCCHHSEPEIFSLIMGYLLFCVGQ
ncbi:hypothetical protein GDO78_017891 [Eleutherodactylus coqui]|uniref:Uncharacterized protein n=1 Tax=Eleutherodactylus coqui TaxID=57060 RepID=A0A8J6JRA9_ELECQ|nr:hypothetical protein GDO78_017891 [Eleutherodactylus coqui]